MVDCLVVGGGVIGLSLAYELAGHGCRVRLIDAGQPGCEASWAGAGILPPACGPPHDPLIQLTALSNALHEQWSDELRESTGIDNGFLRSGAVYLARNPAEVLALDSFARLAQSQQVAVDRLDASRLAGLEPDLCPRGGFDAAWLVPGECQLRNPRHLKALLAGCCRRGVEISAGVSAHDFRVRAGRVVAVDTSQGPIAAETVCLSSGAWTAALAARLGLAPAIKPIRGQIVLLSTPVRRLSRIVNEGSRYLVPRADGRLLIGSTEEDAGFDRSTTAEGVQGLLNFALGLVPALGAAQLERTWAGLRPATVDRLPYLGPVPGVSNAFVAAGHFRGGLQLSTATAVVIGRLVRGLPSGMDLAPFRLDRHPALPATPAARQSRRHAPLA